jgi:Trk-type K+ transport system membrane component
MKKIQFVAVFWTLALAIPFTALAISGAAYLTDHLSTIATTIASIGRSTSASGQGWLVEFAARWPEVAGMIIGQIVIFTILYFAKQANYKEETNNLSK